MVRRKYYTDYTMKINYILINYENVQPADVALLDQAHVAIMVFVGASQAKLTLPPEQAT